MPVNICLCLDAILRQVDGQWVASNPRTHSHVGLSAAAVAVIGKLGHGAPVQEWAASLQSAEGWDRTGLDFRHGLWTDPTRLTAATAPSVQGETLLALLCQRWILSSIGGEDYYAYLAPLSSILDRDHLGTFHQLIGQHLALTLRLRDNWKWWHDSKFQPDGLALKRGPYKWIQEPFFNAYFTRDDVQGQRVLDFACGNGFYARKFAALGADVLGIDTEAELIRLAEKNATAGCRFLQPTDPAACQALLESLEPAFFDRVYLSDILLLLLEAASDGSVALQVMSSLARLLRPGGRLHLFEPNPVFWLGARLGTTDQPMVVVSEYRRQIYTVAPTLDRVMAVMGRVGFVLREFVHPDGGHVPAEEQAVRQFAAQFPMWDFMTFERDDA